MRGTKKDVGRTNGCQVYRKGISAKTSKVGQLHGLQQENDCVLKGGWMYASMLVIPVNDTEVLLVSVPDFEYPKL